ncbi:type VI secretion system lipoprotein TssJ [Yoonia sediminilitoris]|uniref:Type VI secretion system protein VasD n=1 Tax=Yoonia sediminilitoris TaxID=1286148 RepID=A0A2T6KM93_9RHOB|nr:type VI secretion system lipoprotein TssJ [Yoonia sediminilitoris]PUB17277.1 type VI secretion system protein VasD [Yoonia sediminilitoris]RCW97572.1 type VI secretion system protein VasD [Yoonia sediminilitoris]
MSLTRRTMIITGGSALTLAACGGEPGPGRVNVQASMVAGANPAPDGSDRPLIVSMFQLRGTDAFSAADVLSLQDPQTALGGDLIRTEQIVLPPAGAAATDFPIEMGAAALGIVAGFRDPSGKTFRTTIPLPATGDVPLTITVSSSGIAVS